MKEQLLKTNHSCYEQPCVRIITLDVRFGVMQAASNGENLKMRNFSDESDENPWS